MATADYSAAVPGSGTGMGERQRGGWWWGVGEDVNVTGVSDIIIVPENKTCNLVK